MSSYFAAQAEGQETAPLFLQLVVNNDTSEIESQIRQNIARRPKVLEPRPKIDTPLIIAAGGPSLADNVDLIRQFGLPVLAVNGAYNFLLKRGVVADYFMMMDSRASNYVHVENMQRETECILASQVHPDIFERLSTHNVTMYHSFVDSAKRALASMKSGPVHGVLAPLGAAGIHALYIALILGFRNLKLFGYDLSYRGDDHRAFPQPMNDGEFTVDVVVNGVTYRTPGLLALAAEQFPSIAGNLTREQGAEIELWSGGLLSAVLERANREGEKPVEDREREKYEDIWRVDQYRKVSPGMRYVDEALGLLTPEPGASFLDLGCGTGRVVTELRRRGFDAAGVDIAENALEEDVPFTRVALWDALPQADYGFSSDVLEHIPPERVMDVLESIRASIRVACYLNIDTFDDNFGAYIDRKLHMTVMEPSGWIAAAKTLWPNVDAIERTGEVVLICRTR